MLGTWGRRPTTIRSTTSSTTTATSDVTSNHVGSAWIIHIPSGREAARSCARPPVRMTGHRRSSPLAVHQPGACLAVTHLRTDEAGPATLATVLTTSPQEWEYSPPRRSIRDAAPAGLRGVGHTS